MDYPLVVLRSFRKLVVRTITSFFSSQGFPFSGTTIIAPFWADIDTRQNHGHVWLKDFSAVPDRNDLAVSYENVGYYARSGDKINRFQVLISDGRNAVIGLGLGNNDCFCYEEMGWTTGAPSKDVRGFGGVPATVGANKGTENQFF
jgi:hypothetical protein